MTPQYIYIYWVGKMNIKTFSDMICILLRCETDKSVFNESEKSCGGAFG